MATVKELLTNLGDSTRKFLGTSDTLSLEEMSVGIGKASDESDFQTELIEEFSNILDRSAAPDSYANGKEDGYADALDKRTDLVVTENGNYTPPEGSSGFKSVTVEVASSGGGGNNFNDFVTGATTDLYSEVTSIATKLERLGITSANFPKAESIGTSAFGSCSKLTSVNFPNATSIGSYAFKSCSALPIANFPKATSIGGYAFNECSKLTSVNFPNAENVAANAFYGCSKLTSVNFPKVTSIGISAFQYCSALVSADFSKQIVFDSSTFALCYQLKAVILRSTTRCTLSSTHIFDGCYHILGTVNSTYNPNGDKDGYFYVPRALVESYQSATNWSTYASQFRALEDYTVDGTITGALDPNKI